jgi:hypothetical protein
VFGGQLMPNAFCRRAGFALDKSAGFLRNLDAMKTKIALRFTTLALLCLAAVGPKAQAVSPPPDGGYPGFNTAEGDNALKNLNTATGIGNTALGWFSLGLVTDGSFNTGVGVGALVLNTGSSNTATGAAALILNTTGERNTAVGTAAMVNNSTGNDNTAVGDHALTSQTGEGPNTAVGSGALFSNTTGANNTANGAFALFANTEGIENTATGDSALENNTIGFDNTANGFQVLNSNTTGESNTANGAFALFSNTEGGFNTAIGLDALLSNTTGDGNTANGFEALNGNTEGFNNTATGGAALGSNTIGDHNTANGVSALAFNTEGSNNTALGELAGIGVTTASNVICIGAGVDGANVSDTCFIGNIRDVQTQNADAIPVLVDSAGQLGTASSSRRFKKEIKLMESASETILALKPVTFHYKSDKTSTPQFGLIAEDVAEVNPDLVVRDKDGEVYTVRYDAVNAMLLNEFLKEHQTVQELKTTVAQQKKQIEVLTAGLQKVSAQLKLNRPAPQRVDLKIP